MSVPDPGERCPGSSGGCYLIRASFPRAQICHFFPQENATVQVDGFGCCRSPGPRLGAAPEIPALGNGAISGHPTETLKTPLAKRGWTRSCCPGRAPAPSGAGARSQQLSSRHGRAVAAGGPERADGAAAAGAGRPARRAGPGAALAQPRQAGTRPGAQDAPKSPACRAACLPPLPSRRHKQQPREPSWG